MIFPSFAVADTTEVETNDRVSPRGKFAGQHDEFALVADPVDDAGVEDDDNGRRIVRRNVNRLGDGSYERLAWTDGIDVFPNCLHGASHVVMRPMAASGSLPTVSRLPSSQG